MNRPPLDGVRVVVTRSQAQAGTLRETLSAAGAVVESLPLLEVTPPGDPSGLLEAIAHLRSFDWAVFTSVNAVRSVIPHAGIWPEGVRVAAVGPATRSALMAAGIAVDLEAGAPAGGAANAAGLLAILERCLDSATLLRPRVFLPQAADARPELENGLRKAGYEVRRVVAYDKKLPEEAADTARRLFDDHPLGWVTFSSPRVARHFVGIFGTSWGERRSELNAASLGPVTSTALRQSGIEPAVEAAVPSSESLVAAMVAAVRTRSGYQPI